MEFFSEKNIKKQNKTKSISVLKTLKKGLSNFMRKLSFFELILVLIGLVSVSYFINFYIHNTRNFYIKISKGTVFPKEPIASLDSIYQ